MALSDCPECWNTPCTCGYEHRNCSNEYIAKHMASLVKYKEPKDKLEILLDAAKIIINDIKTNNHE